MSRRDFEFRKELLDRDFFSCLGGTVDSVEHLLNSESRFAGAPCGVPFVHASTQF